MNTRNKKDQQLQDAPKFLGYKRNYITFTPGIGFKANFQHY